MAVKQLDCVTCGRVWEFDHKRGRTPSQCPECKEDPARKKQKQEIDDEAKRAAAKKRIDNLETALKAGGNHLSQARERRSYSIAELEERIYQLELWRQSFGTVELVKEAEAGYDPQQLVPRKRRRKAKTT